MPHVARKRSESGYYHVVHKGIADQIIFLDDNDRRRYVELLGEAKDKTNVKIHAYCLMSNHVHIVAESLTESGISDAMKYLHERYGMYFAGKVERTGGIFRKPFWSEPIESDEYLLCAVRYVHANPAAAGICAASAYEWSSAKDYLGRNGIADTSLVLDMCDGVKGFIDFSRRGKATATPFPGSRLRTHLADEEVVRIAKDILGTDDLNLSRLGLEERGRCVELLACRGFSVSQIVRITGLGRGAVEYSLVKRG